MKEKMGHIAPEDNEEEEGVVTEGSPEEKKGEEGGEVRSLDEEVEPA